MSRFSSHLNRCLTGSLSAFAALLIASSASAAEDPYSVELNVLTLNVWDLGTARGEFTDRRLDAICRAFEAGEAAGGDGWDLILVQELWPQAHAAAFDECGYEHVADVEDYSAQPYRALAVALEFFGLDVASDTGLRILSRYPILETRRLTYSVSGYAGRAFFDGESLVRKSAMAAQVLHPEWGPVWVVNTHLVANYASEDYLAYRAIQLQELADWIATELVDAPVIMGGDFNFGPEIAEARDDPMWDGLLPALFQGYTQAPGADEVCTYCASENIFVAANNPAAGDLKIDHLFASPVFEVTEGSVVLDQPVPLRDISTPTGLPLGLLVNSARAAPGSVFEINLSDHFGWQSTVRLRPHPSVDLADDPS